MKEHLLSGSTWLRGLFMLLFAFAYYFAVMVTGVIVLFQFGFLLFTGKHNENLLEVGQSLSAYIYQILRYLTYNSDEKPFPFQAWPTGNELSKSYIKLPPKSE